jgi:hypothetical protein
VLCPLYFVAYELDPTFPLSRHWLGMALVENGKYDEAIALSRQVSPDSQFGWVSVVVVAYAYAKQGKRTDAMQQIALLRELGKTRYVRPLRTHPLPRGGTDCCG